MAGWDHQIVNHGVPGECMDEILKVHTEFFHLPVEEKMKYYSDDMRAPFKYGVGQVAKAYNEQVWKDHLTLLYQEKMDTSTWPTVPERFMYAYTHILSNPSFSNSSCCTGFAHLQHCTLRRYPVV